VSEHTTGVGAAAVSGGKPKVLLVDDDPRVLAGLRRQLHRDFRVVTAGDGVEALTLLSADGDFAVVLSDMRMPGLDGAGLLARVRVASPRSTRILLTGQTELSAAVRAIDDGQIFRFLSKPCPPEALDKCLREAVNRFRGPPGPADRRLMELDGAGTGQFRIQYVPIVALAGAGPIGVEAVLRRPEPGGGIVAARELTVPAGRWLMAAACQEVASWPAAGAGPLGVHLSLPAGQLRDPRLAADLAWSLTLSGLEPERVTLVLPQAPRPPAGRTSSAVTVNVRRLTHEPGDAEARDLAAAAVELGRALPAPTVAADVDCADCQATARRIGCEYARGPLYGQPADPGDLLAGVLTSRP